MESNVILQNTGPSFIFHVISRGQKHEKSM